MRMNTKGLLAAAGVVSLVGTGAAGVNMVSAESGTDDKSSNIISALVEKFNLKESDVQAVFADQREANQQAMETERSDALKEALNDEKITQTQYDYIIAAWEKIDALRTEAGDKDNQTEEQRTAMQTAHEELKTWMVDQELDAKELGLGGGPRGHGPGKQDK